MCHNSVLENEQIEKCIENGMPTKLIKTIKYTMRKRAANEEFNQKLLQQTKQEEQQNILNNNVKSENIKSTPSTTNPVSRCPFGHGKFLTPTTNATFFNTPSSSSTHIKEFYFSNNNNVHERFSTSLTNGNTITNLSGHFNENDAANVADNLLASGKIYNDDILAKSTQLTREVAFVMQQAIKRLQSSKIYT